MKDFRRTLRWTCYSSTAIVAFGSCAAMLLPSSPPEALIHFFSGLLNVGLVVATLSATAYSLVPTQTGDDVVQSWAAVIAVVGWLLLAIWCFCWISFYGWDRHWS